MHTYVNVMTTTYTTDMTTMPAVTRQDIQRKSENNLLSFYRKANSSLFALTTNTVN